MSGSDGRNLALTVLTDVLEKQEFLQIALRRETDRQKDLSERERKFAEYLIRGVIRHKLTLDYVLGQFSNTPVKKIKPVVRNILRMGIFQILYSDSVPDRAACSEAVSLAKRRGFSGLSGYVNAVLRNVSVKKDEIRWPDPVKETTAYLSVAYSMPEWLTDRWLKELGSSECERLLAAFQEERNITLRPNPEKTDADSLQKELEKEGLICRRCKEPDYAIEVQGISNLSELPAFKEGLFYIQDTASMQVAEYAMPKEGDLVVDVCGAPGGKSIQIAQMMRGTGKVITRDISEGKVELICENIERMGLQNMKAEVWDACKADPSLKGKADIVIADLPCSGLGVLGRKTDIRYRVCPDDIEALSKLQRQILDTVCEYVRPGGTLLYSTCTITPEENEQNADWFSVSHDQFEPAEKRQFWPWDRTDGFFIAKWIRK